MKSPTNRNLLILSITVIILMMVNDVAISQKLYLYRLGNKNKIVYQLGDNIKLVTKGSDYYVGGEILGLSDNSIEFENFDIHLDSIQEIDIRGKHLNAFNVGQYGPYLMVAGVGYLAIDAINQDNIDSNSIITASILVGTGYIFWLLREKKFKIRRRNKIQIID